MNVSYNDYHFNIVCPLLFNWVAQSCLTLWDSMDCSTPGFPVHHQLLELAHTHVHQPSTISSSIIPSSPTLNLSEHQSLFQWVRSHIRCLKYWSFSFSISPFNEYSGLISFRMDWLDLLAVQGALKSLLPTPQFKSINSLALSFLNSPTLTSIHDKWKNHSFD